MSDGNFKVKYTDDYSNGFYTTNKIYEIKDGVLVLDNGTRITGITNFYCIQRDFNAKFELVDEDFRELIESGYIVKFKSERWALCLARGNNIIGMNDINDISIGITNTEILNELLIDVFGNSKYDIMEIRGYCPNADQTSINDRPLIWKREEKSPTQLEIESIESEQRKLADRLSELRKGM